MGDCTVYWYGDLEKHKCGYCKNERGSISHGMWTNKLTVQDYQNLIDRGWRRSGHYCYKPVMEEICCPMYTIKCDVLNFQMSKSHKKILKKFSKFLKDGILNKSNPPPQSGEFGNGMSEFLYRELPEHVIKEKTTENLVPNVEIPNSCIIENETGNNDFSKALCKQPKEVKSGIGADSTKPLCKKAKVLRMERKKEKLLKRGMSLENLSKINNEPKSLEEFLNECNDGDKHKLKFQLFNTNSPTMEWKRLLKIEFELYKKYQILVHNDPPEKCKMEGFLRFLVNSPLEITLERIHEKHNYYKLTAKLFAKYQMMIHNEPAEDCDPYHYKNFLIDSPIQHVKFSNDSECGFGSFHQLYWLDDKLIAVGVIDILPKCISAVYFFYDPDYRNLTLGTYGSLRELELARKLNKTVPSLDSYYMGFYIHSCPKMRYKSKLIPSFLLCPETYNWRPIESCIQKLEVNKYARFDEDLDALDEDECTKSDVDNIQVIWKNGRVELFKRYKIKYPDEEMNFRLIGKLVGKPCAKSLLFINGR